MIFLITKFESVTFGRKIVFFPVLFKIEDIWLHYNVTNTFLGEKSKKLSSDLTFEDFFPLFSSLSWNLFFHNALWTSINNSNSPQLLLNYWTSQFSSLMAASKEIPAMNLNTWRLIMGNWLTYTQAHLQD